MTGLRRSGLSLAALAVGLLVIFGLAAGAASAPAKPRLAQPRTLVTSALPIYAFAQDGDRVAWVAGDARVRVRSLSRRRTWVVGKVDPSERAFGVSIALAGTRALWAWDDGGNSYETAFATGAPGRTATRVGGLAGGSRNFGDGERFAGVAGDGTVLAFGWANETCSGAPYGVCDFCNPLGSCPLVVTGGGVAVIPVQASRERPRAIPNAPPPALFTVGAGRLALVAARSPTPQGDWAPRVGEDSPVELFSLEGRLLARIPLVGTVRGIALSPNALAVLLERPDGSKVILRCGVRTGAFLGGSDLLPLGATALAAGTGGLVFRDARQIYQLHGRTPRLVAVGASKPVGLSIEGRRIAWAESVHGRGRIRAVTAP